jgi:UDP-N-acetylglucosamine--N-acetylmuramyl-(pentapeptide) pyrophosphoryl-undecaprenol N-acetylglucosamine transferase
LKKDEAYEFFSFDKNKKTLLIVGGSLGARTINQSVMSAFEKLVQSDVQVIWQQESSISIMSGSLPKITILKTFISQIFFLEWIWSMELRFGYF